MAASSRKPEPDPPTGLNRPAERIFLDYLERLQTDKALVFEDLRAAHPELAKELRSLHADHTRLNAYFFGQRAQPRPDAFASLRPGQVLGGHELIEILGQGGMGQVWEARHVSMGRRVALKVVHPSRISDSALELFAREARAGGRLNHPGIVTVYEFGTTEGLSWISMELVEGARTLHDFIEEQRDTELTEDHCALVAEFIAQVADALEVAHAAGVIHRDIKPQNILVTTQDRPKVADFGLAKITDESALSMTGDFAGTYAYMSPEQALAKRAGIDHLTDVFSLGVVMYEILAGRRPFEGDTAVQLTEQVVTFDPPEIAELRSRVPRDLSVICQKALEKNRNRRYPSMAEFAADLRRHLNNTPIHARPVSRLRKLQLWSLRHPTLSVAGVIALVAMVTISALSLRVWRASQSLELKTVEAQASAAAAIANSEEASRNLQHALVVDEFLQDLLASPSPFQEGRDVTVVSLLDRATERLEHEFEGTPEAQTALQVVLGDCYHELGLFDSALPLQEESLSDLTERLGPDHLETLKAVVGLARTLSLLDRLVEARNLAVRATELCTATLGQGHELTARAQIVLAEIQIFEGDYEAAERVLREVLEGPAEDGPEFRALGLLARNLDLQARFEESAQLFHELIERRTRSLGEEHPMTLAAQENLANHYQLRGMFSKAEPLFRSTLATRVERNGERHPATLIAREALARLMVSKGQWADAEVLFRETQEGQSEVLGALHSNTLRTKANLGWALYKQGKLREAEDLYRETLSTCLAKETPSDYLVPALQTNLSQLLTNAGQTEEAAELVREAIRLRTQLGGAGHPETLSSQCSLARILEQQGALDQAEELWREILAGYLVAFEDKDHYLVLIARGNLGWLLARTDQLAEAEQLLTETLAGSIRTHGRRHSSTNRARLNLAGVLGRLEQLDRAAELYLEGVSVYEELSGQADPDTLWYMVEYGIVLGRASRYEEAERVFATAIERAGEAFGFDSTYASRPQSGMGGLLVHSGRFGEAEAYLRDSLAGRRAGLAAVGELTVMETAGELGRCLSMLDQFEEAESLLLEAHAGLTRLLGKADPRLAQCEDWLVALYERWDREADAEHWRSPR